MLIEKEEPLTQRQNLLQIWMAASPFDVKGNKAITKNFIYLANQLVLPITYVFMHLSSMICLIFTNVFALLNI